MTHEALLLLGERLRSTRDSLGLTQEFVSGEAGITLRFYQMIERGEKSVSLDTLIRLSGVLTVSTDYLLFGRLSYDPGNPLTEALNELPPRRREDALKILQMYVNACKS